MSTVQWINEKEPFLAFLRTCFDMELVALQHEAHEVGDKATVNAVLAELKRRAAQTGLL